MILLNYGHTFTSLQLDRVEELAKSKITQVISIPVHIDFTQPVHAQIEKLIDKTAIGLQCETCIVNLPSHNIIAAYLLASLHGLWGHFPVVLFSRPVIGSVPLRYDICEIIDLQSIRDISRTKRPLL